MGKININYQNGAIGGVLPSTDYISAFIFDSTQLPSGFTSLQRVKQIFSLKGAVDLGITNTSIGETKASGGTVEITTLGAVGDYISVYVEPVNHPKVLLGTTTVVTGDTVNSTITKLNSAINLLVSKTGWTSEIISGGISIELLPPTGLGAALNGAGVITLEHKASTTFVTSVDNFANGAGSEIDLMYYTLEAFFNGSPNAKAYVGIFDFTAAYDANKIKTVQTYANGEIRQMGILLKSGLEDVVDIVTATQNAIADQTTKHKPLSAVVALQPGTLTSATQLVNARTLSASQVSVTISNQYGTDTKGYKLVGATGIYPTDLGEVLAHISKSKVSHSIAWVQNNPTAYDSTMLVTGETWQDISDITLPDEISNKGYIFEGKYQDYAPSVFYNSSVCDSFTSDYKSIERRRTIDKVARVSYVSLIPYISSPVILDAESGKLSDAAIRTFEQVLGDQLTPMYTASEISGYSIVIDPNQNVLATNNLDITVLVVPVGTLDSITVNLTYALSIK